MRVLFLSNFYPPHDYGGYEQWCHEVATGLQARGHEVAVLTSQYRTQANGQDDAASVTRTLYLETDLDYYRPVDFLRRPWRERANRQELRKTIDRFHPDITMIWGMWNLSYNLAYWAEEWLPGRVAYFISNYWPTDVDPHTAFWQLATNRPLLEIVKRPLRALALAKLRYEHYPPALRFEHAVCCSNYVRNYLVERGKLPAQAGVLYGGTDPQPFLEHAKTMRSRTNQQDGSLRLLYFGRLVPDKGVHTALEALVILKQRSLLDDVKLTIIGSGHPAYEAKLRQLVAAHGLDEHVEFIAKIARQEIPAWLGRFDVFLFTSIWPEPMARSVMEAMAAGMLVIGTEVGGQVEMLAHNQNALTFQPEDAETLAAHIAQVARDPALCQRLACAGQKLVLERFTLSRMVCDIEQHLNAVVEKAPPLRVQP
ncbi:MAG: hypothetical protein DCC55_18650 [Chloroflexi bacterium]|nr:MAG: hypothetical protein DCC55_18650 [Chloroflexota bacterium]